MNMQGTSIRLQYLLTLIDRWNMDEVYQNEWEREIRKISLQEKHHRFLIAIISKHVSTCTDDVMIIRNQP